MPRIAEPREPHAVEIEHVREERTAAFWESNQREGLSTLYEFRVVWHEQAYELAATEDAAVVGALRVRIAASLARVEALLVLPHERRRGIGRALVARCEEMASYYNCHKVTLEVPLRSEAQAFFEACGYKIEAVLPQHTFKLDVAVMRKFLL
ncbi:MAG TPA: GNAT family N-acetyltransferase [Candidatus Acidoferrales bacterium]|nr:GNAT family N-acetyltransferase [Candidatus Acidoferrales bacterium]